MRLGINKPDFSSGLAGQGRAGRGRAGARLPAAQGDGEERQGGEARERKAGEGEDWEGSLTDKQMCGARPGEGKVHGRGGRDY